MLMKKSLTAVLVFLMTLSTLSGITTASVSAATDYVQVSRQVNPAEVTTEGEATVELTIQGTPPVSVIRPNDVILIIDKSGSMAGDKMAAARDSAKGFIDLMDMNVHRVGIVDFSSDAQVFPLTTDTNAAKAYVDTINSNGGTGTAKAIDKAVAELLREPREGAQPVIVLMTDGDATEPKPDPYQAALNSAAAAKNQGIVFYTIALLNTNDNPDTSGPNQLLTKMATTSSHHHFVLGSVGLKDIYAAIVKEIGVASAYNVKVTDYVSDKFEIVPDSYLHNIPQPVVSGNEISWSFLELKNNSLNFSYKIRPKNQNATGTFDVATSTANVTYQDYAGANRNKLIPNKSIKVKLPAPVITSIVEPSGHPTGGNEVQINGDKFVNGAKVFFNNTESKSVTFVDGKTLKVVVPAGSQGSATIKVLNPDNQYAIGNYQYIANPEVTTYSPNEGPMEGNTAVSIYGDYFMNGAIVKFGDEPATISTLRSGFISLKTPAGTQAGPVDITILNPDGSQLTIPSGFNYLESVKAKLEITNLNIKTGLTSGGELVYISGKMIDPSVKVYFGNNEAQLKSFVSSERIQVIVPPGQIGEVDVKLVNPDGQEAALEKAYTYANPEYPAPIATMINPKEGEIQGGNSVYVTGSGFVSGVTVFINNIPATVSSTTSTRLKVVIPASAVVGTFDVKVVNPDGKESILPSSYTYILPPPPPAPVLTGITPDNGLISGGTTVSLKGANFINGAVALFDDVEIQTTFESSSLLKIVTPSTSDVKVVQVKVKNPDGQITSENMTYSYMKPQVEPVTIVSLNKTVGLSTGGDTVYLTGTNFQRDVRIFFGGNEAQLKTYSSSTRIGVIVPPSSTLGSVDVSVMNPDGGEFTLPSAYTYSLVQPSITALSVINGPMTGGTTVYITGTNFEPTMTVTVNGIAVPIDSFVSATRVKIITPPSQTAGAVPIVVTLPNGESASISFVYDAPPILPAPIITMTNVSSGSAAGGNNIYVTGKNFVAGSRVFFNGIESSSVIFSSSTRLGVKVPAGTGVVQIKVVNPDGQESNTIEYTYK